MKVSVIIACAGKGERAKQNGNKLFFEYFDEISLTKKAVFLHTLDKFINSNLIDEYIITASYTDYEKISSLVPPFVKVVKGGDSRTQSVKNGLLAVSGDIVLIHDGARPFVSQRIIKDCIESVKAYGSGVTAVPSRDTVCRGNLNIEDYLGKSGLYSVQTPQAFYTKDIINAYERAGDNSFNDDGEVYKAFIGDVRLAQGENKNIKLTYKEDFDALARPQIKMGVGFDCHRLVENRKLILGGIEIPHNKGLLGHSDADVLTHAVMDALLSACGLRDIGYYFPDTDPKFLGADSVKLLEKVIELIRENGYKPKTLSATIMAEKPKLLKIIPTIKENLAMILGIEVDNLGLGATTLEGLGFVGREEGICAQCSVILERI